MAAEQYQGTVLGYLLESEYKLASGGLFWLLAGLSWRPGSTR